MSQPTISDQVSALEGTLGTRLLERTRRGALPTPAGELLVDYAERFVRLREEALAAIDELENTCRGTVRIAASTVPAEYLLPAVLPKIRAKLPDVTVQVSVASSESVLSLVQRGDAEIGITGSDRAASGVEGQAWRPDELILVVPPDHPWSRRRKPITLEELAEEPYVGREPGSGTGRLVKRRLREATGRRQSLLNVVAELGSTTAVKQAVSQGVGVSLLSKCAVAAELSAGLLGQAKVKDLKLVRDFNLVRSQRRQLSPSAGGVRELLLAVKR